MDGKIIATEFHSFRNLDSMMAALTRFKAEHHDSETEARFDEWGDYSEVQFVALRHYAS